MTVSHQGVHAQGLGKRFGDNWALADVDLPAHWTPEETALIALGRQPLPADAADLAGVLPLSL